MNEVRPLPATIIELHAGTLSQHAAEVFSWLCSGKVLIIRQLPMVARLRDEMINYAAILGGNGIREELTAFYLNARPMTTQTLRVLTQVVKKIRSDRFISQLASSLFESLDLPRPIYLDGAIPRLVLPLEQVEAARHSGLFTATDFQRTDGAGDTEMFMPRPANIHRDFNREHEILMCNLWFPLHECGENEVVQLWAEHYADAQVRDQDNTAENRERLGRPTSFHLNFGDAVLFHGEMPHTSPPHPGQGRRHSFDLRIACACSDDNRGYRRNFVHLNNFHTAAQPSTPLSFDFQRLASEHDIPAPADHLSANHFWLYAQHSPSLSGPEIQRVREIFDTYPFAEDRYISLAKLAIRHGALPLGIAILEALTKRTEQYFWLMQCGELLEQAEVSAAARLAYARALDCAKAVIPNNFAPIAYAPLGQTTTPAHQHAIQLLHERLSALAGH